MWVTLLGRVTPVRPVQLANALSPMRVTLAGMVTPVRPVRPLNALSPMRVTGRPSIVAGRVNTVSEPLYPVMVTWPSAVVEVYCACTTAGRASSNQSSKGVAPIQRNRAGQVQCLVTIIIDRFYGPDR